MSGKHDEAALRVGDLIQAMMHLQIGNSHMESGDYESAIRSFELARSQMRYRVRLSFFLVSLISGWRFDDLGITIRQRLCEALYAAGRTMDAGKSLLELVDTFGDDVCMGGSMAEWISGFTHKCLSNPEINGATSKTISNNNLSMRRATLDPQIHTPLLRVWVKATLVNRSWKGSTSSIRCSLSRDSLPTVSSANVSKQPTA
ncbi:hypothetical protein EV363DRAFT_1378544 [Boletus edulis]|nr:hypothetical protein EV363DRAFT_1378544 [Boletus edulis]